MSGKNGRITAYINKKAIAANFQNMKANLKDGVKMVAVIKDGRLRPRCCADRTDGRTV